MVSVVLTVMIPHLVLDPFLLLQHHGGSLLNHLQLVVLWHVGRRNARRLHAHVHARGRRHHVKHAHTWRQGRHGHRGQRRDSWHLCRHKSQVDYYFISYLLWVQFFYTIGTDNSKIMKARNLLKTYCRSNFIQHLGFEHRQWLNCGHHTLPVNSLACHRRACWGGFQSTD